MEFRLAGYPDNIWISARPDYFGVWWLAEKGAPFDEMLDGDTLPVQVQGGVACSLCQEPHRYRDLRQLWVEHLFEETATWIVERLMTATAVCVFEDEGCWGVTLVRNDVRKLDLPHLRYVELPPSARHVPDLPSKRL